MHQVLGISYYNIGTHKYIITVSYGTYYWFGIIHFGQVRQGTST